MRRFFSGEGGQCKGHVFEPFYFDPTRAKHRQRPELRVLHGADDHLLPAQDHTLHIDTLNLGLGLRPARVGHDRFKALRDRLCAFHVEQYAAHVRLVRDVGGGDLEGDGEPHLVRQPRGRLGVVRQCRWHRRDAIGVQDVVGDRLGQKAGTGLRQ